MAAPLSRSTVPARTRRRDPEATRAAILEAALGLFAARGFAATGTAEVARHAGVSEGSVFHHFGNKRGLLAAVAAELGRRMADDVFGPDDAPAQGGAGAADGALGVVRRVFDHVEAHGAALSSLAVTPDPEDRETVARETRRQVVARLASAFRAASARGEMRPMVPDVLAELLFGVVDTAIRACFLQEDGRRREIWIQEVARCLEAATAPLTPPSGGASRRKP